ncbi:hypothetical protein CBR_g29513 [Chara braunii]|uniref:Integrase catalytic domain-containing protein n=1 Tax=Chara braunii TaxID=69332 RepID=A0A388LAL8_CHABU|nr:hypothetical protein CBR_g29513 [Chara braunii]|eukprot:GBG79365.1 hypothetical protein CBR_g29513 [Chara braunii]
MTGAALGMPGQLANESLADYKQRFQAQNTLIEAEEQRQLAAEAARLQAEAAATAEKQRLQAEADADTQARRKEAQVLLQRHEAASIERLKFWHFEPANGEDATPEEQHKEFFSKLVTRLLYTCNYQQSELEKQNQKLQQQYQDLKIQHQELANVRRIVQSHEDATRALNSRVLDLEQAVPGLDAGASSSAPSSRQLEERVDHVVAMLGDISTFAAPTTISSQLDTGEDPAATPSSRDGDQVAVVQPRSNNKSRNNGKAKPASQAGNGQPAPWVKFSLTEAEYKYRGCYGCCYWCNSTKHKTSLCQDQAKEDVRPRLSSGNFAGGEATPPSTPPDSVALLAASCTSGEDANVVSSRYTYKDYAVHLVPPLDQPLHVQQSTACTVSSPSATNSAASPPSIAGDSTSWSRLEELDPLTFADFQWMPVPSTGRLPKPHCNVLMAQLRDYLHTAVPTPLMDAGVEVVDLHAYIAKIDCEFKTQRDVFEGPHGVVPDRPIRLEIILEDRAVPPRGCIYRMSEEELSVLRAQLDDLLEKGWIRSSSSPYRAPVLFVRKKNKDLRLCIDYHKLNAQTIRNVGPLPRIDDLLERLGGAKFFSKLDLKSGYHQLEIQKEDCYKTAFKMQYGHFEWLVMPFSLTNAPTTFQAAMTTEFRHMLDRYVLIYLDDILVYSRSLEEHVEHLRTVLERLRQAKYKANRDKCEFARQKLEYLGHYVTPQGIRPLADKIEALRVWPEPTNTTDVRSFMGLAGYYQRFITGYSRIAAPMTRLQSPKVPFVFDDDARRSFQALKTTMLMAPVLSIYDPALSSDHPPASNYRIADGYLLFHSRGKDLLCVPRDRHLRTRLLGEFHDSRLAGHFGINRTIARLRQRFRWPDLITDVTRYCDSCEVCRRSKPRNRNPYGELRPMPIPREPGLSIAMDVTGPFPRDRLGHDGILTVVDRLSKYARFLPCKYYSTALELARLLHTGWICGHGVPEDIVSDRDTRFMSAFWTALMQESGTKMKPSSARHPLTDGQTERAHQTAQMMLRTLIRPDQKDWVERLPNIEFAYNTLVHPTIGVTPFELHHGGRKGRIFADLLLPRPTDIDAACSPASVRKYRELPTQARANMQKAQVCMQQQANRRRVPCPIRAGDLVWVSAEEFALEQDVSRKLLPKWFGPWSVTSAAGDEPDGPSFVINIPEHLTVHPVFHASKLATYTPAKSDDFPGRRSQDPPFMDGH